MLPRLPLFLAALAALGRPAAADRLETLTHETFINPSVLARLDQYNATEYEVSIDSVTLTDTGTGIPNIVALHVSRPFAIDSA